MNCNILDARRTLGTARHRGTATGHGGIATPGAAEHSTMSLEITSLGRGEIMPMKHKALRRRASGQTGFTLVELLAVIAIMSVLAAASMPMIINQRRSSALQETRGDLQTMVAVMNSYMVSNYGEMPNVKITCKDQASAGSGTGTGSCQFPCNPGGSCGSAAETVEIYAGTSGSTSTAVSGSAVSTAQYGPIETVDKSKNVKLVYAPCYFNHSGSSLTPCDASNWAQPTTRNFDVYAYNEHMAPSIKALLYKSKTGKYYKVLNANPADPIPSGCQGDSGSGEVICELG